LLATLIKARRSRKGYAKTSAFVFAFCETLIARQNLARIMDVVLVAETQSVRVMVIFEPDDGATKHYDRKR